jgi:hypothetical protein
MGETRCCDGDVSCACEHRWSPEDERAYILEAQEKLLASMTVTLTRLGEKLRIATDALGFLAERREEHPTSKTVADDALTQMSLVEKAP